MLLILLATILILAIAYFQVTQGFFSAMIMTILSVISLVLAFNFYEPLAKLMYPYQPASADGIALLVLFVVLLLAMRMAIDRFFKANVVLGQWVDRLGGGALGIITGMILVGMLAVVVQMQPWGRSIIGYSPFDDSLNRSQRLWPFRPDEFVAGAAKALSAQSLGSQSGGGFGKAHDDLLLEQFCARNTAGRNSRIDAETNAFAVEAAYLNWVSDIPICPLLKDEITKAIVIRVEVRRGASDDDGWWRLPGTHFRLVGTSGRSYYPVGYLATSARSLASGGWECVGPRDGGVAVPGQLIAEKRFGEDDDAIVDWVYQILNNDEPDYMVFRRIVRDAVPKPTRGRPNPDKAMQAVGD